MATQKLYKREPEPPLSDYKAGQLCVERAKLDEERLDYDRKARGLADRIKGIDRQLLEFVRQTKKGRLAVRELTRHRLEIVQKANSFFYKGALEDLIGIEELERRRAEKGTHDELVITEKSPGEPRPRTKASPRARHQPRGGKAA